ncbi:MAG: stage III sporulation protein AC [Ruminococcaceae bacterium]|nr:stage III sporulation protein AC [Oscillospiraceae bacterium]
MDLTLVFKIVIVGIVISIMNQLLQKAGKEEYTLLTTIVGLIIVLMMVLPHITELKDVLTSVMEF